MVHAILLLNWPVSLADASTRFTLIIFAAQRRTTIGFSPEREIKNNLNAPDHEVRGGTLKTASGAPRRKEFGSGRVVYVPGVVMTASFQSAK